LEGRKAKSQKMTAFTNHNQSCPGFVKGKDQEKKTNTNTDNVFQKPEQADTNKKVTE